MGIVDKGESFVKKRVVNFVKRGVSVAQRGMRKSAGSRK